MTDLLSRTGIVIVTYNSADVVSGAVGALAPDLLRRTVLIDNASTDDTLGCLTRYAEAGATVITSSFNQGFGGAVNRAVAELPDADYVLVLNPDAVIEKPDLTMLLEHLAAHPRCGVVVPRLWRGDVPLSSARRRTGLLSVLWPVAPAAIAARLPDSSLPPDHAVSGPVVAVEGACMLIRAKIFSDLGGFDDGYFLYFEELDLAQRLRALGLTSDLCADARAEHLVGHARTQTAYAAAPSYVTSTLRYLRKWHPLRARLYPPLARACWALRTRFGGLEPDLARAYHAALLDDRARP